MPIRAITVDIVGTRVTRVHASELIDYHRRWAVALSSSTMEYEAYDETTEVSIGTPVNIPDDESRKKPVPVQDQVVTDEQGRPPLQTPHTTLTTHPMQWNLRLHHPHNPQNHATRTTHASGTFASIPSPDSLPIPRQRPPTLLHSQQSATRLSGFRAPSQAHFYRATDASPTFAVTATPSLHRKSLFTE